jgi:hypothetical protein
MLLCRKQFFDTLPAVAAPATSCPATTVPPEELCCTRLLSNPATTLRVGLPNSTTLSTITVSGWLSNGTLVPGVEWLSGLSVKLASDTSVHTCAAAGVVSAGAARAGFVGRELLCGARQDVVVGRERLILKLPRSIAKQLGRDGAAASICWRNSSAKGATPTIWVSA